MRLRLLARSGLRLTGRDIFEQRQPSAKAPAYIGKVERSGPVGSFLGQRGPIRADFEVPIDLCTSFVGLPYARNDWNPLTATLKEYETSQDLAYPESALGRLHTTFAPRNCNELFFGERTVSEMLLATPPVRRVFRNIWDVDASTIRAQRTAERSPSYYFGPMDPSVGEAEFRRLLNVYDSIKKKGYRPEPGAAVSGYFVGDETSCRFVVGSGNHRVAVLSALGRETVPARLHSHPAVVHKRQLSDWTTRRDGPFTQATAHALFDLFLNGSGRWRAAELGTA